MKGDKRRKNPRVRPSERHRELAAVSSMFFIISFLGWCMETVYCSGFFTRFPDRGFLTLPFCVIYGAPPCIAFLLFGTPGRGRLADAVGKRVREKAANAFWRFFFYFLLSAALATLFELVFGVLFGAFGVRLWNYRRFPANYRGYICPQFSLLWGVLITSFMALAWPPVFRVVSRLPCKAAAALNLILWLAVFGDFSFNLAYLIVRGCRFRPGFLP